MMLIDDALQEVQQPRSRYQLERFVLGAHRTPEMMFRQLVIEIQDVSYKLRTARLEVEKALLEIQRLQDTGDEIEAVEAEIKRVGLEQTRLAMLGAEQEIAVLYDIYESIPHFTRDEIEAAQPEYWADRLTRDLRFQQIGTQQGVNAAHIDSADQAGILDRLLDPGPIPVTEQQPQLPKM